MAVIIQCDGCDIILDPETGKFEMAARRAADAAGWLTSPNRTEYYGKDFCPKCRKAAESSQDVA